MAKLPSSFRARNRTTRSFREQYARLPSHVQELVRAACLLGEIIPTGIVPTFAEEVAQMGYQDRVKLTKELFAVT